MSTQNFGYEMIEMSSFAVHKHSEIIVPTCSYIDSSYAHSHPRPPKIKGEQHGHGAIATECWTTADRLWHNVLPKPAIATSKTNQQNHWFFNSLWLVEQSNYSKQCEKPELNHHVLNVKILSWIDFGPINLQSPRFCARKMVKTRPFFSHPIF